MGLSCNPRLEKRADDFIFHCQEPASQTGTGPPKTTGVQADAKAQTKRDKTYNRNKADRRGMEGSMPTRTSGGERAKGRPARRPEKKAEVSSSLGNGRKWNKDIGEPHTKEQEATPFASGPMESLPAVLASAPRRPLQAAAARHDN